MPPARKSAVSSCDRFATCGFPAPALMMTGTVELNRFPRVLWRNLALVPVVVCSISVVLVHARRDHVVESLVAVHRRHARDASGDPGPHVLDQHEQLLCTKSRATRLRAHLTERRAQFAMRARGQ